MLVVHLLAAFALIAVTATAVAHALGMPGKMRLSRDDYLAVQRIYFPGFTIVGAAELPTVALLVGSAAATPVGDPAGYWRWAAASLTAAAQAVYWGVVHPTNGQWLANERSVGETSGSFFRLGAVDADWRSQRRRWEAGHLVRCLLAVPATASVVMAMAIG